MHIIHRKTIPVVTIFLFLVALIIFIISVAPIHVLRGWTISVPQASYHPGDTISLSTSSTKLRKAKSSVERVVECDVRKDSTVGYSINQSEGSGKPGFNSRTYDIKIPLNVTDLPVTCRVIVTADYKVYGFRHIVEHATSNEFIIN